MTTKIERLKTEEHKYIFIDSNGKKTTITAPDVELATLRAWKLDPNLTFKKGKI
jgi:hypothetical protein